MPPQLSFIGPPEPPIAGTTRTRAEPVATPATRLEEATGEPLSDFQTVEDLVSRLEFAPMPEEPKVGIGPRILGTLGDAILAMASVRAGGVPPPFGPFAATLRARQEDFERRTADAEAADRDLRNRLRIGTFQEQRRLRLGQRVEIERERRKSELDEKAQVARFESGVKSALISRIIDLGIDTGELDLTTASTPQLQKILSDRDPVEELKTLIEAIPEGREVDEIIERANGTFRITTKPKGEVPRIDDRILVRLAEGGADVRALVADNPALADALAKVTERSRRVALTERASDFYQGQRDLMLDFSFKEVPRPAEEGGGFETVPDKVNTALASAFSDLDTLMQGNATGERVIRWYNAEADEAADTLQKDEWTPLEANNYLTALRKAIPVGFPGLVIPETPVAPRTPIQEPEPTVAAAAGGGIFSTISGALGLNRQANIEAQAATRARRERVSPAPEQEPIDFEAELKSLREQRDALLEELKKLPLGRAGTKTSNPRHGPLKQEIAEIEGRIRRLQAESLRATAGGVVSK